MQTCAKICLAKKPKPNTSACKARLGCGLCGCAAWPAPRASHRQAHARHTKERSRRKPHTTPHTHIKGGRSLCSRQQKYRWGASPPSVFFLPSVCVVWCVVFYMSVLLCGARVLDNVRRGPGSAPAEPAAKSCLADPKSALGSLLFMTGNHVFVSDISHITII